MLIQQGSGTNLTAQNSIEARLVKRQVAVPYFIERHVAFLPALRTLRGECELSRNEILTLLAAKHYERKHQNSFTAKVIAVNSGIGCNNLNAHLSQLTKAGFLRVETRGRKANYEPSRYCLTQKGIDILKRLEDLTGQFIGNS